MMQIVTGLRFVERNVPVAPDLVAVLKTQRILQQQLTEIWFAVEQGTLVMKDRRLGWHDVPLNKVPDLTDPNKFLCNESLTHGN